MNFLAEDATRWRLVLAADVLIYFGALEELLAAVHPRLQPGGWFIFSVEELLPDHDGMVPRQWRLGAATAGTLRAQHGLRRQCGAARPGSPIAHS